MQQSLSTLASTMSRVASCPGGKKEEVSGAVFAGTGESLAEVTHEARNMVTALGLYCDLLEEPGVLATPFSHYAQELRLIAAASRRLVEKLAALGAPLAPTETFGTGSLKALFSLGLESRDLAATDQEMKPTQKTASASRTELLATLPIANLAAELLANRNLLAALAGPSVILTVDVQGCAQRIRLSGEELTRVLVNLIKNATEAMPRGGRVHITLREQPAGKGTSPTVTMTVEDNGPGIPSGDREKIFLSGFTTHAPDEPGNGIWPVRHRGLGLAITRSIVEGAGGRITALNRETGGARFEIELPIRQSGRGSSSQRS
jgi:signal transduction histidine kinase